MSSGFDRDETLSVLHDQLMTDEEMTNNWRQISALLKERTLRAQKSYNADPENRNKAQKYLKCSKEYYSFTRLVYLFGKMIQNAQEELAITQIGPSNPAKKSDLN